MRIGFLQTAPVFGGKRENVDKVLSQIKRLDVELLVLPELFNTGYQFITKDEVRFLSEKVPEGDTTKSLAAVSREKNIYIVAGLAEQEQENLYNSSVLVGPEGFIGRYRKLHLFYHEKQWFEPGNCAPEVYDIGHAKIGIMICFDWFFPEVARYITMKGADILCHPANLVLPYCPQGMITRCLENKIFAVTANRIGIEKRTDESFNFIGNSQILSTGGEIIYRASYDKEETKVVEIDPNLARNKYITSNNHVLDDRKTKFLQ